MAGRSSISGTDRWWGCLPYLLPLIEIAGAIALVVMLVPALAPLKLFLALIAPVIQIYSTLIGLIPLGLGSFAVFVLMYLAVVQNEQISYSIRFNTLQAMLFSIVLSLWNMLTKLVITGSGELGILLSLLMPVAILGVCVYSIGSTALGKYPDVPKLSENVYMMLPR
jgi:hypothetical protein